MKSYELAKDQLENIREDGVYKIDRHGARAFIPKNEKNMDWLDYQEWLKAPGNKAKVPVVDEELKAKRLKAIQPPDEKAAKIEAAALGKAKKEALARIDVQKIVAAKTFKELKQVIIDIVQVMGVE